MRSGVSLWKEPSPTIAFSDVSGCDETRCGTEHMIIFTNTETDSVISSEQA